MTKKIKKTIATILISFLLFMSSGSPVVAWETWASLPMKQGLEEIFQILWSTLLKNMKQEAIKQISEQVTNMIAGSTGENYIIMDYEDFIYDSTDDEIDDFASDFFAILQEGLSPGEREILRDVEDAIRSDLTPEKPVSTLREVVQSADPVEDIFNQSVGGGEEALLSYAFGEYNNQFSTYFNTRDALVAQMTRMQESAKTEALAGQGFKTMVNGNNVMPGSIYQHLIATAEAAPIEMITNATRWQEVVASFVTTMVGSAIKNGIKTTSNPDSNDNRRMNRSDKEGFPGVQTRIYQDL